MQYLDWVEAVPNISTADPTILSKVKRHFQDTTDVFLLHIDTSPGLQRSVLTIVGSIESVLKVIHNIVEILLAKADISTYASDHPHIGALDVCPIISLHAHFKEEAVSRVKIFGQILSDHFDLPVFFYADLSTAPQRQHLSYFRKGGPLGLQKRIQTGEVFPDLGPPILNPKLGGLCLGVRDLMIAYNINLSKTDFKNARRLARLVRNSWTDVKAIAWYSSDFDRHQLSMNIYYARQKSLPAIYSKIQDLAADLSIRCTGSELIGLIPLSALGLTWETYTARKADIITEKLGLAQVKEFDPQKNILDIKIELVTGIRII